MRKSSIALLNLSTFLSVLIACKKDKKETDAVGEPAKYDGTVYSLNSGAFPAPVIAFDNQLTVQGVELGRMLFYEKSLSRDNSMACANCHKQEFAFDDTANFSIGVLGLKGKRQAMAIFNTAWHTNEFFWDGRSHLLRDQSLMPIQDTLEMFETLPSIISKLSMNPIYQAQFIRAFGTSEVTSEKVSKAMEQFMNSIVSNDSKYDRYLGGSATLTPSEDNGRKLFFLEYNQFFPSQSGAECSHCHSGFNFTNNDYMNNGLDNDASITDIGRKKVTNIAADKGKFKVPSLRNIALTAPYMHDGRFKTLEEVVNHYNNGLQASTYIDPALENTRGTGLMLTGQQKADLVNFLKTLTDYSMVNNPKYKSPF